MSAIEESLRNIVRRQQLAFGKVMSESSSIKAMLEKDLQTQAEKALQEFTVTMIVSPITRAAVVVMSKTPPL